jgi:hypothetical protein
MFEFIKFWGLSILVAGVLTAFVWFIILGLARKDARVRKQMCECVEMTSNVSWCTSVIVNQNY